MVRSAAAASVLLLLSAPASATPTTPGIKWYACQQNSSTPTTCGTLQVPLDYSKTALSESLTLQLVKINATTQPSKGSILFNFGGPGNINVDSFAGSSGQALLLMTGGVYDLITFEPRGLGITIPYSCFNSSAARAANTAATPQALDTSDKAVGAAWAAAGALSEACYENVGDIGQLVGTSFVARDVMQIVDALGEDGLLRYYGFSYGTTLGATVAAMFPERIDKLLLDGVVNPTEYWTGLPYSTVLDTDITLSAFFAACIELPDLCALARNDSSAGDLLRRVRHLLRSLRTSGNQIDIATYGSLKSAIVGALYFPSTWSSLADKLAAVLGINVTESAGTNAPSPFPPSLFPDLSGPEVAIGIQCADAALRLDDLPGLQPILARFKAESWIRGDGDVPINLLKCARWKLASKERYNGSFDDIRTKSPALIVGNSIDPTTPLAAARNLSEGLKGSVLLQNNGYGHTTIASPSLCIALHARAYFVNGTMPPAGTVCESVTSTQPLAFSGSYYDAISSLGNVSKRSISVAEEREDFALLNAVREFGKGFAERQMGLRPN